MTVWRRVLFTWVLVVEAVLWVSSRVAADLYKLQHCSGSTAKTTYGKVRAPAAWQTHRTFNIQIAVSDTSLQLQQARVG